MGQKFVTVDENDVVKEPYDSDNGNVPVGARSITEIEFKQLAGGFNLFKHIGGILVPNQIKVEEKLKQQLLLIEEQNTIQELINTSMIPKIAQINGMNETALNAAIAAGGLA